MCPRDSRIHKNKGRETAPSLPCTMHTQTQAHQPSTMKQRHMNQPCWHRHSNQPCWDIGTWTSHAETQAHGPAMLRHRHKNQPWWDAGTWTSHAEWDTGTWTSHADTGPNTSHTNHPPTPCHSYPSTYAGKATQLCTAFVFEVAVATFRHLFPTQLWTHSMK